MTGRIAPQVRNGSGPYFLPHQSRSYCYAPSSEENLTSEILFKSEAVYFFQSTKYPTKYILKFV